MIAVIFHVGGCGAEGWLGDLARVRVIVPNSRGWRRVAGHGVAGVRAVLQRNLAVLVKFLELGSPILEPDLDLCKINKQTSKITIHVSFLSGTVNNINSNDSLIELNCCLTFLKEN